MDNEIIYQQLLDPNGSHCVQCHCVLRGIIHGVRSTTRTAWIRQYELDCVQDAFLAYFKRHTQYVAHPCHELLGFCIGRNRTLDLLRRLRRQQEVQLDPQHFEGLEARNSDNFARQHDVVLESIIRLASQVPLPNITLRLRGMTYQEIAVQLGGSESTSRRRFRKELALVAWRLRALELPA